MKVNIGKFYKNGNRNINVKIDRFDTWNLDATLAYIILPALVQLRAEKHGVPSEFANIAGGGDHEMQLSFDFYRDTYDESFDIACKQWDETLDKMIWSFQQIAIEDYDNQYHHGEAKISWLETDQQYPNPTTGKMESTYQMVDENPDEHWYDHVGHLLHEERIQEGLDLFSKYYRNLWD